MRRTPIVFSGWNQRGIIAFCRFCRLRNIPFYIVAKDKNDPILLTDFRKNVFKIRSESVITIPFMKNLYNDFTNQDNGKPILMPSTEYLNRFFLSNRDELESVGYQIPLCDRVLYNTISDKADFEKICKEYGIATPFEYENVSEENIPFVVKPKKYFLGGMIDVAEKPRLIMNEEDYKKLRIIDKDGYFFQEFIGGETYYLLYYFSADGTYSIYSQKNFVQQHKGLSVVAAEASTIHNDLRAEKYTRMFQHLGFRGLVMVEIRVFKGQFYMIEANPRFWGPSQLILDAGMDLYDRFALDYNLTSEISKSKYKPGTKYSWFGGIINTSSLKESITFHSNYTAEEYINNISDWLANDIYNRKDTRNLFLSEF